MADLFREVTHTDFQITAPADGSDYHLGIISSDGPVNVDLPLIETVQLGQRFTVACEDGSAATNNISVRRQSPDFIQGATQYLINVGYGAATFFSNGKQYVIDSSNVPQVLTVDKGGTGGSTPEEASANLGATTNKLPCRFATTGNIGDFVNSAPLYVDNVANDKPVQVGDRILVWQEANMPNNNIYVVKLAGTGSNGTWELASDVYTDELVYSGISTFVSEGDTYADKTFILTTDNPITLGATNLNWSMSGGTGALEEGKIFIGNSSDQAEARDISGDISLVSNGLVMITRAPEQVVKNYITNNTGGSLLPGTPVRIKANADGTIGVVRADSDSGLDATHVVGNATIANSAGGYIHKFITMGSLNTSAAVDVGSKVYLSAMGAYVFDTPPSGANMIVQEIGTVAAKDASNGVIIFNVCTPSKLGGTSLQDGAVTIDKTDIAASFTGDALASHSHTLSYTAEVVMSVSHKKLHTDSGVTGMPQDGATLLQAVTGATAIVTTYVSGGLNRFTLNTITGTFSTADLVTGTNPDTSTFTFTPTDTLLDCWQLVATPAAFSAIAAITGPLVQTVDGLSLATGQARYIVANNQIETLSSDAYPFIGAEFASATSSSVGAGTPSGTINLT